MQSISKLPPVLRKDAVWATALFLIVAVAFLIIYRDYLFSAFLHADDNNFLPRAIFGEPDVSLTRPRKFLVIGLPGVFGSLAFIKFVNTLIISIIAPLTYLIVRKTGAARFSSGLIALALAAFPLAVEQPFFVSGSHPTMGAAWALAAIYVFLGIKDASSTRTFLFRIGLVFLFSAFAALFSPVFFLMPVAPLLWLAFIAIIREGARKRSAAAIAVLVVPVIVIVKFGLGGHHYTRLQGWTDFSVQHILGNLAAALTDISSPIYARPLPFLLMLLTCIAGVAAAVIYNAAARSPLPDAASPRRAKDWDACLLLVAISLISSALAFGPGAITALMRERYVVGPFIFGFLAFAAPLALAISGARSGARNGFVAAMTIFVCLSFFLRGVDLDRDYGRKLEFHQQIARLVQAERARWPIESQILIVVTSPGVTATSGLNHWSTWYLRALADRRDLIGLVGVKKWLETDPFVDKYADGGRVFWETSGGRTHRLKMMGLERERPLYAYRINLGSDRSNTDPVIFRYRGGYYEVPPGEKPVDASLTEAPCSTGDQGPLVWPTPADLQIPGVSQGSIIRPRPVALEKRSYEFDGADSLVTDLQLNKGENFDLNFTLVPAGGVKSQGKFSPDYPPMPFLSEPLAVYQTPNGFRFMVRTEGKLTIESGSGSKPVDVRVFGEEGCNYYLQLQNEAPHLMNASSFSGDLMFGHGFLERYWAGDITGLSLFIDGSEVTRERLPVQAEAVE